MDFICTTSTRVRNPRKDLWQRMIDLLRSRGERSYARGTFPAESELELTAAELGVQSMLQSGTAPDLLHRTSASREGFSLNASLEAVSEDIRRILEVPDVKSKIERLVERAVNFEAHIVVVSAEGLSSNSRFALMPNQPERQMPTSHIRLPQGLRRIWVIEPDGLGLSFDVRSGYEVHDFRGVCTPSPSD